MLRDLSNGKYGVQDLIFDLMSKYGKDKPFEDDQLFEEIVSITGFHELRDFFEKYVVGIQPLPLKNLLEKVGLKFNEESGKIRKIQPLTEEQTILRKSWIDQ